MQGSGYSWDCGHWERGHSLGLRTFCPLVFHAAGTAAVQSRCRRDRGLQRLCFALGPRTFCPPVFYAAGTAALQRLCFALGARTFCPLVSHCSRDGCGPKPMQPGRLRSKAHAARTAAVRKRCFALGPRTFCPLIAHAAGTAAVQGFAPHWDRGHSARQFFMQPGRLRSEAAAVQEGWGPSITTPWVGPPICVDWATLLLERCSFGCVFAVDSTMVSGTCATFLWQHS